MTTAELNRDHHTDGRDRVWVRPSAVVHVDRDGATIARIDAHGTVSTCEIERGTLAELTYLATVAASVGDRDRVMVVGPDESRLALEREYEAIYQRPDRLIDVETDDPIDDAALIERLRGLVA